MTEFSPSKTPITAGGSVLYPRLSDAEIESIMQHVAEHDKTGTEIGRDRMLYIATYWRNAADNYESAVLKAIAIQGRYHVMELLREVNRLRRIVDALPKTADGVPIYPGMHVWFYAARSVSQSIDELKVLGWDWLPNLAPDTMHYLNVVNEHGDEDAVNLACCYSTFDAANQARFAVKEIASRKASDPPEIPQEDLPYHVCPDDPQGRVNSYPCYAGPIWELIQRENPDPSKKAGKDPQSHDPSQGGLTGQGG